MLKHLQAGATRNEVLVRLINTTNERNLVQGQGVISYHGRSNFLGIEGIPGAIFQKDNVRPHVAKTVRDFCSAQHQELLPWPAYSPDMSHIEHVWDLVGQRLVHDPRPAASKHELLLHIHAERKCLGYLDFMLVLLLPHRIGMCQNKAHEIHHGKGLDCMPVVSRSLEHHTSDNTFWLGSTSVMRMNTLGAVRSLPPLLLFHQSCGSTAT
ncbi:hypothetical protein TNCV_4147031 [Trichonephila clavipes]|nr:hypothetical protein TNCV_4147031 [Trichonephila clavipes]